MIAIALDLTLKATGIAVLGFLLAALMGRASAASRHLVWTSVFAALAVLPVARLTLPVVNLAVLTPPPAARVVAPLVIAAEPDPGHATTSVAPVQAPAGPAREGRTVGTSVWTTDRLLLVSWIAGGSFVWLRAIIGAVRTRRLGHRARPAIEADLIVRLERARQALRVRRPIRLLISTDGWTPVTWGVLRPTILLPSHALAWRTACPDRIDAVFAHEVAHIARWDVVAKFVARLGNLMFWFHPLMWIAARQGRLERERACDDAVLALGSRPSDYAGHLVAVVRSLRAPATMPDALAMARLSQIERRVRAILDARVNRHGASRMSVVMAAALVAAVLPVASARLTARAMPTDVPVPVATLVPALPPPPPPPATKSSARSQTASSQAPAAWRAEREALLRQLIERAQQHWRNSRLRVEIGTMAPADTKTAETTVRTLEAALLAEQQRTDLNRAPSDAEIADVRQRFAQALRNLDAAEVRSNNGMITAIELSTAVLAAADVIRRPATAQAADQAGGIADTTRVPRSIAGDDNNARALYELLTGRVTSITRTGQLQRLVEDLVKRQRDVAARVASLGSADTEHRAQLSQIKDEMRSAVAEVEQQLGRLDRESQAARDWDAARRFQDTAGLIRDKMIKDKIEYSKQAMAAGSQYAEPLEKEITSNLDAVRQRIDEAAAAADRARRAPLSDVALVAALKDAAAIAAATDSANALVALALRQPFTPEMVSLYVTAASGISSEAERARAFAQGIRLKPAGR
jgi:beta-lactamase regulating signal transducer with metallopeptidase domain